MFTKLSKLLKIFKFAANTVLKDGTEILIDGNLEAGVNIYVVTSDGDQPLPDGEYELGEPHVGYLIVVEGGLITSVVEPVDDTTDEPPVKEDAKVDDVVDDKGEVSLEQEILDLKESITSILERLTKLEETNSDLSKENEELKRQNENFTTQVNDFQLKLEKMNGAEPIKKKVGTDDVFISQSSNVKKLHALLKKQG